MIAFERFVLDNGLRLLVHEDKDTPLLVVNTLYDVGARDESPDKTGFAHLFEHLMFAGSQHVGAFDEQLQRAGGSSNAFTTNDLTNYYDILPAVNLETALWLESDRMLCLAFSEQSLEVQKKVVVEEFKQRYLNQPYGDVWLHLRPLVYERHPYRWSTIGCCPEHIEQATLDDVRDFFYRHYRPNRAILVIAGNVDTSRVLHQVEHWYSDIRPGMSFHRILPQEPPQQQARLREVYADVPLSAIYKAYPIVGSSHKDFYALNMLATILGAGDSSRLYQELVEKQHIFHSIQAYVVAHLDPGMLVIQGKVNQGVSLQRAHQALEQVLDQVLDQGVQNREVEKVRHQMAVQWEAELMELANRAYFLAFFELLGDAARINDEQLLYEAVTPEQVRKAAQTFILPHRSNTLFYVSTQQKNENTA